jgi:hypothetical protein
MEFEHVPDGGKFSLGDVNASLLEQTRTFGMIM